MSETIQLEELLNEKASMEDESCDLDQEQRQLKDRAKALTAKIIEELRKKNNAKQESVNNLQSKVNELELELSKLQEPNTKESTEDIVEETPQAPIPQETTDPFEQPSQETTEGNVSVAEVGPEVDVATAADSKDKKKRKFF